MPPPIYGGGAPEIRKVAPLLCRASGGGELLKYLDDDKMGRFLGHFYKYGGSNPQIFRALRAREVKTTRFSSFPKRHTTLIWHKND